MDLGVITYYVMLPMLEYFRHMLGSYGWAIIVVTLLIKLLLLPLSIKQSISSRQMQEKMSKVKPEIDRLKERFELRRKKHQNDPDKLEEVQKEFQEQMMEVYRSNGGFNPLGGCLPLLLQFPILIALYWTFNGPPFHDSVMHFQVEADQKVAVEHLASLKHVKSNTVNYVDPNGKLGRFRLVSDIPERLSVGEKHEVQLEKVAGEAELPSKAISWHLLAEGNPREVPTEDSEWHKNIVELQVGGNPKRATLVAKKPTDPFHVQAALDEARGHESFFFIEDLGRVGIIDREAKSFSLANVHWDILVLILLAGGSLWLSSKLMSGSMPQAPTLDDSQQAMQKQMQTIMPLMFIGIFFFIPVPAGVFIYLLITNLAQIIQTRVIGKVVPRTE